MTVIYTTKSGSKHYVDYYEKNYKWVPDGDNSPSVDLRHDDDTLTLVGANRPSVGEVLVVVLAPFGGKEETYRMTTPVVTIEVV